MSEKTDTPITDAFYDGPCNSATNQRQRAFARDLEREAAAWRAVAEKYRRHFYESDIRIANEAFDALKSQLTKPRATRQTRQLNEATAQYGRSLDELMTERDEAIEQRDRLAEVLRMIATHNESDGQCDNGHTPRWMALHSLASLERKEDG